MSDLIRPRESIKIVTVHGFNEKNFGARNIDTLAPLLEGMGYNVDIDTADYGYLSLWKARRGWKNNDLLRRLKKAFTWADVILAHSNGGSYSIKALNDMPFDTKPKLLIMFSPAMNRKVDIPKPVLEMHIFHTKGDGWVRLSGMLIKHHWGLAGCYGYNGTDQRGQHNHDESSVHGEHSGYFKPENRRLYAGKADEVIRNVLL